jgi:hypothetical protein
MRWVDGHAFNHNSLVGEAREDWFSYQHGHNYSVLGFSLSTVNTTLYPQKIKCRVATKAFRNIDTEFARGQRFG